MDTIDVGDPIAQGAEPHGKMTLGNGPDTVGQSGCLLCCLVMAARALHQDRDLDVPEALRVIRESRGFDGSKLMRSAACKALGMEIVAWEGAYDHGDVVEALSEGCPVVLGIDYKRGRSSAKSDADHFVLAVACLAGKVLFADPATGTIGEIDIKDPQYRGKSCHLAETMMIALR